MIGKLRRGFERYEPLELAGEVRRRAGARIKADEEHIWYSVSLRRTEPAALPAGYTLAELGSGSTAPLDEMRTVPSAHAERLITEYGARVWMARNARAIAFSCFIFPDRMPMIAAPRGVLSMPPAFSCLEYSFTDSAHRGLGIAACVWSQVFAELRTEGTSVVITKAESDNVAVGKALLKAGFTELGRMEFHRLGFRRRTSFELVANARSAEEEDAGRALAYALEGAPAGTI